ncbi:bacterioferritin-associated ferredoxin [Lacimicrobium alkaliphilum]|uniref:Bacterioferritin-associated ferredoxin n=1 Tax=Lacimicrobium alkaliphilum TaxID=1526571 RepID=A0ABQ1R5M6_9ALTE|nr:bacterioferritin-associated ferredoxin [Lacimicrobium alkaliphilum]GGD56576.1 bacterioferritin-associated ferredoxin [Lacimicrobium alkaliphilum]
MFVCLCHGITDKQIAETVREQGIGNMRELRKQLGVGSQCGKCVQLAQQVVDNTIIDESLFKEVC